MKLLKLNTIGAVVTLTILALMPQTLPAQTFSTVHAFYFNDGSNPMAGLAVSGNVLYGTAAFGGSVGDGTVFKVNKDGTGFTLLYDAGNDGNGFEPQGNLVLSGNTLYGTMSDNVSPYDPNGTVFKVNTDGTGFATLHRFTGGSDGSKPLAGLVLSGGTLYGTTSADGGTGQETVFKVNIDGGGFATLHTFTGGNDGGNPKAGLILSGSTLYGTTFAGGTNNLGTVFKVDTDGTNFTTLYSFTGDNDGSQPTAELLLLGSTLYGTTSARNPSGYGTVFQISTNGTEFTTLHAFAGYIDGATPEAGLTASGSTLYGTTSSGFGGTAGGTVFKMNTDGTGFVTLYSFTGPSDGAIPEAGLLLSGNTLYGTAYNFGSGSAGTVFSLQIGSSIGVGTLQVGIGPALAVSAGAQWQVDGGAWQNSGATVSNLSVGSHTVSFKTVGGWNTPDSQSVTINDNLGTSASGTYTARAFVGVLTLLSPAGSFDSGLTERYTWKADDNAVWYELYIVRNGSLFLDRWFALSNSVVDRATGNFAVDLSGHTSGSYQWYVRGWSIDGLGPWSGPMNFSLTIPGAAGLLTPTNNASLVNRQPALTWSQSFPAATWFRLYVTRNQTLYRDQWIQGATNWTPTANLPAGNYSWFVQTYNSAGLGPWSTNSSFTIPVAIPTSIVLVSPAGSIPAGPTQRYTWKADAAAVWYELYVIQNGKVLCDKWLTLNSSVVDSATGNFAVDVSGHTGGSYQWYVRGWSPDGLGQWSSMGSFTMSPPPPPGAVTLLAPANNANVLVRQPAFTWTASSPGASWYYLYVARNGGKYLDQWVQATTNWVVTSGLPGGTYTWSVRPWNEAGYGPSSTNSTFTIQTAAPGAITLVSPLGSVPAGSTQRYTWKADAAATWYELYVVRNGSAFGDHWYTLTDSVVDTATGNFAVDVSGHTSGNYQWYVRGWGPDGLGGWTTSLTFQIQ